MVMRVLLTEAMQEKKISFRGLEKLTGISHSTLNDIATGKISPRLDVLEIIAEKLEMTISDLYESPYK
jgi:DNA-binding Xre family transcriptional regulator